MQVAPTFKAKRRNSLAGDSVKPAFRLSLRHDLYQHSADMMHASFHGGGGGGGGGAPVPVAVAVAMAVAVAVAVAVAPMVKDDDSGLTTVNSALTGGRRRLY